MPQRLFKLTAPVPVLVAVAAVAFVVLAQAPRAGGEATALAEGFPATAKRAVPAVVSVFSSKTIPVSPSGSDPFWRDFFGGDFDMPRQYRERGQGSGVVLTADGYVLTNEHVVNGATDIRIQSGGTLYVVIEPK